MALHYIIPGRNNLPSLLLTCLLYLGAYNTVAASVPADVTNWKTTNVTETSFIVTWTNSTNLNVTSYTVIINNGTSVIKNTTTNTSPDPVTGLLPGVVYIITVYAIDNTGTNSPGITWNETTLPSSVSAFQITAVLTDQMNLSWTIPNDVNKNTYQYSINRQPGNVNYTSTSSYSVINGLSPGMNYTFTIFTLTQNGVKSQTPQQASNTTLPSSVSTFQVTAVWTNQMNLSWTTPTTDVNRNTYQYSINRQPGNINNISTSSFILINGLSPGTDYTFTIFTLTQNGVKSQTSQKASNTTLPSVVIGLTVVSRTQNSVTLSWTSSSDPNASNYTYTVNGGTSQQTGIKTNTTEIKGLAPGTDYSFTVFAVTSDGVYSAASNVSSATTQPSTVTGLTVSSVTNSSVTLTWTLSTDVNSLSYSYTVNFGSTNITGIKTSPTVITGLAPGTEYSFTIYAVTSNGTYSNPSTVTKGTTKPNIVEGVQVLTVSETTVTLQWDLSKDINTKDYTYTVDGIGNNFTKISNIASNSVVIKNLLPGVDYNFTVSAVTKNNVPSDPSQTISTTTKPSIVLGVTVSDVSESTVTLQWDLSKDINTKSYTYTVDGTGNNFTKISNIGNNSVVIPNLLPGVDYSFNVSAVTKNNVPSQPSISVPTTTLPSTVPTFQISGKSNESISLKWSFPNDINSKTYKYMVVMNDSNLPETTSNSLDVRSLLAGETYSFTIYTITINNIKSHKYSIISSTTQPNAPSNLQGNAVNISEIYITWTKPEDVNVNFYEYNVTWQDTTSPSGTMNDITEDAHYNIKSLLPGHFYNIIVTSVIKNTESVNAEIFTATKSVTTENLAVESVNNTSVTLKWQIPNTPSSVVSGYRVTVYVNGNKKMEIVTTEKMYVVNNLEPGNVYNITVESFSQNSTPGRSTRMARADTSIITYSTPTYIKVETYPDPVRDLKCTKVDAYQIRVTSACPVGNYSAFDVLVNNDPKIKNSTCPLQIVVPNLQPTISYQISVKTVATEKVTISGIIICETDNTGVIVGSIFGVLLFLLLIAVIAFFVLKWRRSKGTHESFSDHGLQSRRYHHSIPKHNFKQHYEKNHADSDFGFAEEYQALNPVGTTQSKRAADLPDNKVKNRFTNVLPYDHSRVKLSVINGTASSDYINANYMPGYNSTKEFIASQGPLANTTADFWRMVWEHQVNTIVMLTNCMENGRAKCEHYWPLDYTPCTYGDIAVTVTSETILSEWTIRDFSMRRDNQPSIKYVRHFHFTAWPDHGVPESTSSIIQFRNLVREHMDQQRSNGPTIVHCSAGVGRTGTLIAIDYLIQQIEKEQRIGVYGFVEKMRLSRNLMVQTEAQYVFLNKCILDLIDEPGDEPIYENQTGKELVYENFSAIRNHHRENA
ncbi:receptor-type tyrosine-protein phosphatase H [Anomaloglossus baeobatrachus]|uniref:receptor-type tyrosine-protein phosphatase H n=1 Tax=Anomaloglossus baeobatrachus TaxID=238106 RepID=UPI003F4F7138